MDARDRNLDPSAHVVSSLLTEPSPQGNCFICRQRQQGSEPFILMFLSLVWIMNEGSKKPRDTCPKLYDKEVVKMEVSKP